MSIPYAVVVYNSARGFNRKSSEVIITSCRQQQRRQGSHVIRSRIGSNAQAMLQSVASRFLFPAARDRTSTQLRVTAIRTCSSFIHRRTIPYQSRLRKWFCWLTDVAQPYPMRYLYEPPGQRRAYQSFQKQSYASAVFGHREHLSCAL